MITPDPRLWDLRVVGPGFMSRKKRSKNGSPNGDRNSVRTVLTTVMLTTAGLTFSTARTTGVRRRSSARAGAASTMANSSRRRGAPRRISGSRPFRAACECGPRWADAC